MNIINILNLVSPIPPSVNHYLGWRGILKNGKPMAVSYKKPEATRYQKEFAKYVVEQVRKQNWIISDNKYSHYYMDCVFYFPRTDMDANNVFKCLADAITDTGCVWIDDTQLCERVQGIYYDSENPRIEITIHPVDYIGVFDSTSQLEKFQSNCIGCARYKRNCSILRQAKEGRVQTEIAECVCTKYKKSKGE